MGSQGRNTETRLRQATQIVGQFCTALTGNFFVLNYHVTRFLLREKRAKPKELKSVRTWELLHQDFFHQQMYTIIKHMKC